LKDDLFAGTTTEDKVFNTFSDALYIRLAWINEMKDKKCDSSVLKQFNDGKLQTVKLYKDGSESFEHRSTANTLPNLIIDNGVAHRVLAYRTQAKFVDKMKWMKEIIDSNDIMKDFVDDFTNNDKDRVSKQDMLNQV
jgi:antitoxin component YwqK of YwqJK toxin-antitoxin module